MASSEGSATRQLAELFYVTPVPSQPPPMAQEGQQQASMLRERYENPLTVGPPEELLPVATSPCDGVGGGRPEGVYFILTFCNVVVIKAGGGCGPGPLVLVDAGAKQIAGALSNFLSDAFSGCWIESIVYTHGHVDHVGAARELIAEHRCTINRSVAIIGHSNVQARFGRYGVTKGYNATINIRQFSLDENSGAADNEALVDAVGEVFGSLLPVTDAYNLHPPTVETAHGPVWTRQVGNVELHLLHNKGETDDATWVWVPQYGALCVGDFVTWCAPNCGNPQKVQRYPLEWAAALDRMLLVVSAPTASGGAQASGSLTMLPGHGPPMIGRQRVAHVLTTTAEFLRRVTHTTLSLMNRGVPLNEIVCTVRDDPRCRPTAAHSHHGTASTHGALMEPFLAPYYDDPSFIVRSVVRLYGGWYSGFLPDLHPSRHRDTGRLLMRLLEYVGAEGDDTGAAASRGLRRAIAFLERHVSDAGADPPGRIDRARCALAITEFVYLGATTGTRHEGPGTVDPASHKALHQLRETILRLLLSGEMSLMGRGIYKASLRDMERISSSNDHSKL